MEKINERIEALEKMVMKGNGRGPLNVTVSRIEERQNAMINSINDLSKDMKELTTTVSALVKTIEFFEGEKKGEEKIKKINRWAIGTMASTIVMLLIFILKFILWKN